MKFHVKSNKLGFPCHTALSHMHWWPSCRSFHSPPRLVGPSRWGASRLPATDLPFRSSGWLPRSCGCLAPISYLEDHSQVVVSNLIVWLSFGLKNSSLQSHLATLGRAQSFSSSSAPRFWSLGAKLVSWVLRIGGTESSRRLHLRTVP